MGIALVGVKDCRMSWMVRGINGVAEGGGLEGVCGVGVGREDMLELAEGWVIASAAAGVSVLRRERARAAKVAWRGAKWWGRADWAGGNWLAYWGKMEGKAWAICV